MKRMSISSGEPGTRGGPSREEYLRLAAMLKSCDEAIIALDEQGTICSWNPAAGDLFGYTFEEVEGRPLSVLAPDEFKEEFSRMESNARLGRPERAETQGLHKEGSMLDLAITISPVLDSTGSALGSSVVARDISESRRLIAALTTTLNELDRALREARETEEHCRLLTDAAHQLRNPLTGIRVCTDALLEDPPEEDRQNLLGELATSATRATGMMNHLLQLARMDRGEPLMRTHSDIVKICTDEVTRARRLAGKLEIALEKEASSAHAEVDPQAVAEILTNLLDNARRHAATRIEVTVTRSHDAVEVRVADDGPGVPESEEERIFERFVSLGTSGGFGLGLPIARAFAQAHGGTVKYERPAFLVRLPVKDEEEG